MGKQWGCPHITSNQPLDLIFTQENNTALTDSDFMKQWLFSELLLLFHFTIPSIYSLPDDTNMDMQQCTKNLSTQCSI